MMMWPKLRPEWLYLIACVASAVTAVWFTESGVALGVCVVLVVSAIGLNSWSTLRRLERGECQRGTDERI
jgi:hypothetical protein